MVKLMKKMKNLKIEPIPILIKLIPNQITVKMFNSFTKRSGSSSCKKNGSFTDFIIYVFMSVLKLYYTLIDTKFLNTLFSLKLCFSISSKNTTKK